MAKRILTQNTLDDFTKHFAETLKRGDIILLSGPMGAGKTAFAKSLIPHITQCDDDVQSPTFPICLTYDGYTNVVHYDLYRLNAPVDLEEYGWSEMREHAITIIEWPERADPYYLSAPGYRIAIDFGDTDDARALEIISL